MAKKFESRQAELEFLLGEAGVMQGLSDAGVAGWEELATMEDELLVETVESINESTLPLLRELQEIMLIVEKEKEPEAEAEPVKEEKPKAKEKEPKPAVPKSEIGSVPPKMDAHEAFLFIEEKIAGKW